MSVRVVTYNILVPKLAEQPGFFYKCRHEFLDTRNRWRLIQQQLLKEIRTHPNTIICLQEVSDILLNELKLFFQRVNYTFFESLYNNQHNDTRGAAIAIPATMQVVFQYFITVGDHLRNTIRSLNRKSSFFSTLWLQSVRRASAVKSGKADNNVWEVAIEKRNRLIFLQVLINGRPLSIGTYHMPCLYHQPAVMTIHALAVKDLMFQLSNGHPFILAGDFNVQPNEVPYRVLTKRAVAEQVTLPNIPNGNSSYPFHKQLLLQSAYRARTGKEPNFTNFSTTPSAPNFLATLDYIFFAGRLTVTNVLPLPSAPTSESYPDHDHPSDHLMLAASFHL